MPQTIPTAPETKRGAGTRKPPGPRSFSPLGSAPAIARDTQAFVWEMWQHYGDIVRFRLLFWPAYALYHPDHLKYVLKETDFAVAQSSVLTLLLLSGRIALPYLILMYSTNYA